ncbi:reverse transcriptase [Senna tora]|uniref:Reverse transcriptase n=1 Tax=Senna tora TaxID=362788 RepID=A0A834T446_9FABA|nr:reverse transcriptase [Senna tora]
MGLVSISSELEIHNALFSLKPYKAAGIDGFQPAFFQKCWHILKTEIISCIQHSFVSATIPPSWNDTSICLIPKVPNSTEVKSFRPISLCTSLYKIISKIIVSRLKPLLPPLISENQGAYVPGRKAIDNVLIAQEISHSFSRKKRGKWGWMIIKLDLEKAFDKISWPFILSTLSHLNFPPHLVNLINSCISSVKHRVLVNGGLTNSITPSRGIRQGDPLSPFIFICGMQFFTEIIDAQVRRRKWTPPTIKGTKISHLLFADDVLLFSRVDDKSIASIAHSLNLFLMCSGLSINRTKSNIWFSPNTSVAMRNKASAGLHLKSVDKLGSYLGFPLGIKGRTREFAPILEKIKNRIQIWKAKHLSTAGKVTLLNSVIAPLTSFYMQCIPFPISICNELDKILRDFFWWSNSERKKVHTISWHNISLPRNLGGLGIFKSRERNIALLAKLSWQVQNNPLKTWSKCISHYLSNPSNKSHSLTGKGLIQGQILLNSGLMKIIYSVENTNFYLDEWTSMPTIRSYLQGPLNRTDLTLSVHDVASDLGVWKWDSLSFEIPQPLKECITATPIFKSSRKNDLLVWRYHISGNFTLKSAYLLATNLIIAPSVSHSFNWIWHLKCHTKLRYFIWACINNALPTRAILNRRTTHIPPYCPLCNYEPESIDHILRNCFHSKRVWDTNGFSSSDPIAFNTWLKHNATLDNAHLLGIPHNLVFIYTLWSIWLARNSLLFKDKPFCANLTAKQGLKSAAELFFLGSQNIRSTVPVPINIKWHPPADSWVKLNTDGACTGNPGPFAIGGLIRDAQGNWIKGFSSYIGYGTALKAKIWAITSGLKLAKSLNFDISLLLTFLSVQLKHTYREGNFCADLLAKTALQDRSCMKIFNNVPSFARLVFLADIHGVSFVREVSNSGVT